MTGTFKAVPYKVTVPAADEYDSDRTETRWRLVDAATGRIVDDAQGHGYRTAQAAYRAYGYQTAMRRRGTRAKTVKQRVQAWWATHERLHAELEDMQLQALKQGLSDRAMRQACAQYLDEHAPGLHGLTVADLLRYC